MKLRKKLKIGYAVASIGDSAVYTFMSAFLMFFLTTVAKIDPAIAGAIAALGAIWNSLWGPVVGFLSDHTTARFGRRRPFILIAAFPLAVSVSLLFNHLEVSMGFKIFYYALMVLVFWSSYANFFIPYLALGAEITDDYDERTALRSHAYIMNVLGMMVGMVLPTIIVDFLMNSDLSASAAWRMTGILVGIVSLITILITWRATRGQERTLQKSLHHDQVKFKSMIIKMVKGYIEVCRLKPLQYIICASIFYLLGHTMHGANRMYFFTYNMGLVGWQKTVIMAIITFMGIFLAAPILQLSRRFDKRIVFIFSLGISALLIVVMRLTGIPNLPALLVFAFVYGIGNTCYWQLAPTMIYDICELDELMHHKRREGTVISLQSFAEAISSALSLQILGIILKASGFNGTAAVQTENAEFWISNCFSVVPAAFMILSMVMIIKYPIGKEQFNHIKSLLDLKRAGKPYDISAVERYL